MIGRTISHYKVIEKLGEGGMGLVYKAEDLKLHRLVALKFLPTTVLKSDDDIKRFHQEAQVLSSLNSPHIATIYDVDETDGQRFIVMEYLPSGTLREKLKGLNASGERFSVSQTVEFALQIAQGLAHAHKRGIVHRDIKTDNIMLSEDLTVKITDFGLAKISGGIQITRATSTIGTAGYMSPEQIRGEDVDHRSDLFSLAIVLYEILTGHLPFRGDHEQAVHYSIVNEPPIPLSGQRTDVPPALVTLVERCLEKDVQHRTQTADEIVSELRSIQQQLSHEPQAEAQAQKSVAVLPFVDMSPDKDQEYFCDGIAEELINALARIPGLRVPAQTSAFSFKGKGLDVQEIGRKLNVQFILEGSLRKSGNRLRITAQLVDVGNGFHLWSDRFDRELNDVFAIQDEITLAIVENLKVRLLGQKKESFLKRSTANVHAYSLYLKGRYFWNKRTAKDIQTGIEYIQRATELDPEFAAAYAGLADCFCVLSFYGNVSQQEAFREAKSAALHALRLDPSLAEAYTALAAVKLAGEWLFQDAESDFVRAIELNPNYATAHHWYGIFLSRLGRFDDGMQHLREAIQLDPFSPVIGTNVGVSHYLAGDNDAAIEQLRRTLELDNQFRPAHMALGQALRQKGLLEDAIEEFERAGELDKDPWVLSQIIHVKGLMGKTEDAKKYLRTLTELERQRLVPHMCFAIAYAGLNEPTRALEYMEKEFSKPSAFWFFSRTDPVLNDLRKHPEFARIARKVGIDPS